MAMPGSLIKEFKTQADWESGTLTNLSTTAVPGAITPTGDHIKTWATQADWNGGTKSDIDVSSQGEITLSEDTVSMTYASYTSLAQSTSYGYFLVGQEISPGAYLGEFILQFRAFGFTIPCTPIVMDMDTDEILWEGLPVNIYVSSNMQNVVGTPRMLISGKKIRVGVRYPGMAGDGALAIALSPGGPGIPVERPPGVTTGGRYRNEYNRTNWNNLSSWGNSLYVRYTTGYIAEGSWLSPWVNHGVVSPQAIFPTLAATIPAGTNLKAEIRYSANGGATTSNWEEFQHGQPTPGTILGYYQIKLTLTSDPGKTVSPQITGCTMATNPLHRWVSPAIDVAGKGEQLLSVIGQTGLKVTHPGLFERGAQDTITLTLDILKIDATAQSLASLSLYEAVVLQMLADPTPSIRPPAVTDVICYVEDSVPLVEVTASLGVADDKQVQVRISVPAGSSEAYAQAYADAYLAIHGVEKRSLTCMVPLCTRIGFGELVAVAFAAWGTTMANPWLAMAQKKVHRPLANPPHTELVLGDFEPDDTEALIRLLTRGA